MNIDDVLNDSIDVQDNVDATLQATLNGQNATMDRVTEIERQQTTLKDKIALMDDQRVGKLADGSQNATALDGHSKVTNESFRASVTTREKTPDVNNDDVTHVDVDTHDDDDDGGYSLMPIDVSDKTIKSFKRASLDAAIASLDTINIDSFNVTTTLSFKEYQHRATDKEIHLVANPKYMTFELKVISVFAGRNDQNLP